MLLIRVQERIIPGGLGEICWGAVGGKGGEERREFVLRSKQSEGKTLVA